MPKKSCVSNKHELNRCKSQYESEEWDVQLRLREQIDKYVSTSSSWEELVRSEMSLLWEQTADRNKAFTHAKNLKRYLIFKSSKGPFECIVDDIITLIQKRQIEIQNHQTIVQQWHNQNPYICYYVPISPSQETYYTAPLEGYLQGEEQNSQKIESGCEQGVDTYQEE